VNDMGRMKINPCVRVLLHLLSTYMATFCNGLQNAVPHEHCRAIGVLPGPVQSGTATSACCGFNNAVP